MDRLERQVRRELGRFGPVAGDTQHGDIVGIVRAWPAAVGETVARNAWPARFARDGTLHVNTASATWAFELGRLVTTILEQLRSELGESTPPALRFAPGPIPEPEPEAAERRAPTAPADRLRAPCGGRRNRGRNRGRGAARVRRESGRREPRARV